MQKSHNTRLDAAVKKRLKLFVVFNPHYTEQAATEEALVEWLDRHEDRKPGNVVPFQPSGRAA